MKPKKYTTKSGETLWGFQIYLGRDSITGKKIMKRRMGFTSKNEALIEYARMLEEKETGIYKRDNHSKDSITVKDLYESWHKEYAPTVERSTLSKVESYFNNHILPDFGSEIVRKVNGGQLQTQLNKWASEAKSGVVWGRYLHKLFNYAILHDVIAFNPFDKVTTPRLINTKRERKIDNFLNSEQLTRFLKYWEDKPIKQYAYFRLLSYSGMRRGEILALNWGDINFKNKTVRINKSIGWDYRGGSTAQYLKETKTGASNRTISLDDKTLSILVDYKKTQNYTRSKDPIWPGKNTWMDFNVPERWLQSMRKDENVDDDLKDVTLHGLRHTHATLLFEQAAQLGKQAPIKAVQKRLGHSTVEMTLEVYSHTTDRGTELIENILNNNL